MSGPLPERPESHDSEQTQWLRLGTLMATVGGGFVWVVTNWEAVRPVLYSPASALVAMMSLYGLGGLSIYWIVTRPMEVRLNKAESLIGTLREVERSLIRDDVDKASRIAALEVTVSFLTDQLTDLRQTMQRMQSEASLVRRDARTPTKPRTRKE